MAIVWCIDFVIIIFVSTITRLLHEQCGGMCHHACLARIPCKYTQYCAKDGIGIGHTQIAWHYQNHSRSASFTKRSRICQFVKTFVQNTNVLFICALRQLFFLTNMNVDTSFVPFSSAGEQTILSTIMTHLKQCQSQFNNEAFKQATLTVIPIEQINSEAKEQYEKRSNGVLGYKDFVVKALLKWFKYQFFSWVNEPQWYVQIIRDIYTYFNNSSFCQKTTKMIGMTEPNGQGNDIKHFD